MGVGGVPVAFVCLHGAVSSQYSEWREVAKTAFYDPKNADVVT